MKPRETVMLLGLAALWGGSFPFMRAAAPDFGPIPLIAARLLVAAVAFLPVLLPRMRRAEDRKLLTGCWKALLVNGLLSAAIPFCLLAYSTLSLTAGFTSLLNALTPITTALIARMLWQARLRAGQRLGLAMGLGGVAVLCWGRMSFQAGGSGWAVVTAILATVCYGLGGNLAKRQFAGLPADLTAGGTLIGAALGMVVPGWLAWPASMPPPGAWVSVLVLGVFCTSAAYLLYFRLLLTATATQVASVTFLVPVFSILWGGLLLGESLTLQMVAASVIILTGTALTNGLIGPRLGRD